MFDALITSGSVTTADDTLLCNVYYLAALPSPAQHPSQLPEPSALVTVTATHPVHGQWHPQRRRFMSRPGAPSIQGLK